MVNYVKRLLVIDKYKLTDFVMSFRPSLTIIYPSDK